MQVVVQAAAPRLAEEHPGELFQLGGTQCLEATGQLVAAVEQAVDVLLDEALALADRCGVAKQEKHPGLGFDLAVGHAMQQPLEQLDRCRFVAVDAGGQQQVQPAILVFGRAHFERALPNQRKRAPLGVAGLLGRFVIGEGQLKQFAKGEHRYFLSGGGRNRGHGRDRRLRRPPPVPFPAAG